MRKKIYGQYKKLRHSVRLLLESNEKINDSRLTSKSKEFISKYNSCPIDEKKIVFSNYMGRGYGCNCKYLAEEIINQNKEYDMVWIVNSNEDAAAFPSNIRLVDYSSEEALYELATAKFWISNYHFNSFIKKGLTKRPGQYYIQMWHGSFGIKKIERHAVEAMESNMWRQVAMKNSSMTDYWISNSDFETNIYNTAFWNVNNIEVLGHPRNDIFFRDNSLLRQKILSQYNISIAKNIVLYMPTFREDYRLDCYNIDSARLCKKLEEKYGSNWVLLVRLHPRIAKLKDKFLGGYGSTNVIDVTTYDDVQELLAAADVMISDYSSCIFDYLLAKKPAFIYATDIDEYESERGFYYSLYDTPFAIAKNNDELIENVDKYNEEAYLQKVEAFLQEKGSMEDGRASERIIEFIGRLK